MRDGSIMLQFIQFVTVLAVTIWLGIQMIGVF